MIYTGNNEYPIYLGNAEIPAIYAGDELIYPVNLGTLTGITLENITWVTDVPFSGGTADKDNCSYKVVAYYDSGKSRTVTSKATVTGDLAVSATTAETREAVGTLELTATYSGFTASGTVTAYQEAVVFVPTGYLNLNNVSGVSITTNFYPNQVYTNAGNYMRIELNVDFTAGVGSGNYLWLAGNGRPWFSFEQTSGNKQYQNIGSRTAQGSDNWNTTRTTATDVFVYNNGKWSMTKGAQSKTGTWTGLLGGNDAVFKFFTSTHCAYSFYRMKVFNSPTATRPIYDFCPDLDGNNVPCIYESINHTYHYSLDSAKISFIPFS